MVVDFIIVLRNYLGCMDLPMISPSFSSIIYTDNKWLRYFKQSDDRLHPHSYN